MTDRNVTLKKLLFGYHAEASTMLRAGYYDVDDAIGRFIAYIESEKVIRDYLEDCVENYVPEGFDAKKSVEKVSSQYGMTFAHFSPDYRGESGEVYLILKAILGEGGMTKGNLLLSYMNGSKKYDDMVKNFMNKVVRKLVDGIDRYLTELAGDFHRFYGACRIKGEEPAILAARLKLADSVRSVLANGLGLLGVTAPEKM